MVVPQEPSAPGEHRIGEVIFDVRCRERVEAQSVIPACIVYSTPFAPSVAAWLESLHRTVDQGPLQR